MDAGSAQAAVAGLLLAPDLRVHSHDVWQVIDLKYKYVNGAARCGGRARHPADWGKARRVARQAKIAAKTQLRCIIITNATDLHVK